MIYILYCTVLYNVCPCILYLVFYSIILFLILPFTCFVTYCLFKINRYNISNYIFITIYFFIYFYSGRVPKPVDAISFIDEGKLVEHAPGDDIIRPMTANSGRL